ncbi:MAG: fructose-bisphosphatase class II, partial [Ardenticatenaceae bacterium]
MHKRNLGLDLVRATEVAALNAGRWMGLGSRDEPDRAATEAMHKALSPIDVDGVIVVGEEGKVGWNSPLHSGRQVCTGQGPPMDVVVDAIDGRGLLATGRSGAIAVAAMAPRGAMWCPRPAVYMDKIVVSRE